MKKRLSLLLACSSFSPKPVVAATTGLIILSVAPYPVDPVALFVSILIVSSFIRKSKDYTNGFSIYTIGLISVLLGGGLSPYVADKVSSYFELEVNGFLRIAFAVALTLWFPIIKWIGVTTRIWAAHHD